MTRKTTCSQPVFIAAIPFSSSICRAVTVDEGVEFLGWNVPIGEALQQIGSTTKSPNTPRIPL